MESVESMFLRADKAIDNGDIEKAKEILIQILTEDPQYGLAHNHLGWLYKTKYSDSSRAEKHYRLAIKFAPKHPAAYLNYISLLRDNGRVEELEIMIEEASKVKLISKSNLYDERGSLYELKGDFAHAIENYKKAIMFSMNDSNIEELREHIERCKMKRDFFSPNRFARAYRILTGKQ
jgi:Tfp pilus assembly protein PilF